MHVEDEELLSLYFRHYRMAFETACGSGDTYDEIDSLIDEFHGVMAEVASRL